jgi:hypothetical protein
MSSTCVIRWLNMLYLSPCRCDRNTELYHTLTHTSFLKGYSCLDCHLSHKTTLVTSIFHSFEIVSSAQMEQILVQQIQWTSGNHMACPCMVILSKIGHTTINMTKHSQSENRKIHSKTIVKLRAFGGKTHLWGFPGQVFRIIISCQTCIVGAVHWDERMNNDCHAVYY